MKIKYLIIIIALSSCIKKPENIVPIINPTSTIPGVNTVIGIDTVTIQKIDIPEGIYKNVKDTIVFKQLGDSVLVSTSTGDLLKRKFKIYKNDIIYYEDYQVYQLLKSYRALPVNIYYDIDGKYFTYDNQVNGYYSSKLTL